MNGKSIFCHSGELANLDANIFIFTVPSSDFLKGDLGWAESYVEEIGKLQTYRFFYGEPEIFMNFQDM